VALPPGGEAQRRAFTPGLGDSARVIWFWLSGHVVDDTRRVKNPKHGLRQALILLLFQALFS
jgi:hypothetical protein